jgi:hypothetical protein
MIEELIGYRWIVPAPGFSWRRRRPMQPDALPSSLRGVSGSEPELRWSLAREGGKRILTYDSVAEGRRGTFSPFAPESALYRRFAETPPSREGILGFVNEYGLLGAGPLSSLRRGDATPPKVDPVELTELYWARQIRALKELVDLVDLCDRGDEDGLSNLVRWNNKQSKVTYYPPRLGHFDLSKDPADLEVVIAVARWHDDESHKSPLGDLFSRFTPGDAILPALVHVQREVDKRINDNGIRPRLLWDDGRLHIRCIPETLLQALWLGFADSLRDKFSYTFCGACGGWVRIGRKGSRKDRQYCSDACRAQAQRERRQSAYDMHLQGKTIQEIAQDVGSQPEVVERWIGRIEREKKDGAKTTRGRRGGDLPEGQ